MSVFIFDQHGAQELPMAHTLARSGPLVNIYTEKREPRGEAAAIVHLADDTMVSLFRPAKGLEHDPQSWPRFAGRAPGVYLRLHGATHAFPAGTCPGVSYRLMEENAFVEVFTADRMFISNHLDLDYEQTPNELLLATLRFAPGVIVGDGSRGALKPVGGDPANVPARRIGGS